MDDNVKRAPYLGELGPRMLAGRGELVVRELEILGCELVRRMPRRTAGLLRRLNRAELLADTPGEEGLRGALQEKGT